MKTYTSSLIAIGLALSLPVIADETPDKEIETIVVKGELLPTTAKNAANSIDVINKEALEKSGADHIQDVLQQVGNVNIASGSSRARFFQIRGIGERSQFVDPVTPSVGVAIDGIDYTGIGNAATLFDIDQVEVFKGPQGTSVGANAMAGFINLNSTATGSDQESKLRLELGNYGLQQVAAAFGGDISDDAEFRVSASKLQGDGYIENTYLDRKDTNGFDELAIRAAVDAQVTNEYSISAVLHKFDIDNGYDAFSLDLDRTTLSDEPGFDRQDTTAFGLTQKYVGLNAVDVKLFLSLSSSDLAYGYDEDWSYVGIAPGWEYSSTDHYFRERAANQLDFSVTSKDKDWVVGLYNQSLSTDLLREYTYAAADFLSKYDVVNTAVYGEKRHALADNIEVSVGLRVEQYTGDYTDSNAINSDTDETMIGGHFSANKQYNDEFMAYFRISRGFKTGGINGEALANVGSEADIELQQKLLNNSSFESETLDNVELGLRFNSADNKLSAAANLFYSTRTNMQIKQWITNEDEVLAGIEAPTFIGYISNAPSGSNSGVETNVSYQLLDAVRLYGAFSILETEVDGLYRKVGTGVYVNIDGEDVEIEERVSLDGREQAHAPKYQFNLGTNLQITDSVSLDLSVTGKDEFFYSYSHDEKSDAVVLANASLTYKGDIFDVTLWGRNLTDEEYGVRGFYFGNDPRDEYAPKNWEQFGEPSVIGIKVDYIF